MLLLLVYDYQAEIIKRGEHGGACAYYDVGAAFFDPFISVKSLTLGKP
jgi:hypothetical protein